MPLCHWIRFAAFLPTKSRMLRYFLRSATLELAWKSQRQMLRLWGGLQQNLRSSDLPTEIDTISRRGHFLFCIDSCLFLPYLPWFYFALGSAAARCFNPSSLNKQLVELQFTLVPSLWRPKQVTFQPPCNKVKLRKHCPAVHLGLPAERRVGAMFSPLEVWGAERSPASWWSNRVM